MHVVVVVRGQLLDDRRRALQTRARAHKDLRRTDADEARDEILRKPAVDLTGRPRRALAPVPPWVVHVDVEPVLVRSVADSSEARTEVSAALAREVADAGTRCARVGGRVLAQDAQQRPDEALVAVAPPAPVR
jgi:hypothetical protein